VETMLELTHGTEVILELKHILLAVKQKMVWGYLICLEMFGSGRVRNGLNTTMARKNVANLLDQAPSVSFVAAVGTASPAMFGQLFVTAFRSTIATAVWVSAC